MPRKKVRHYSEKEKDAILSRFLPNTQLAQQEQREPVIRRACQAVGLDPDDQHQRDIAFGYFALLFLDPGLYPRAAKSKKTKISSEDGYVIMLAHGFIERMKPELRQRIDKKILSKIIDMAIEAAENAEKLEIRPDPTASKHRIMRILSRQFEQRSPGQK